MRIKCAFCGKKEVSNDGISNNRIFCDTCLKEKNIDRYVPKFICMKCGKSFYREYAGKFCNCGSINIVSHLEFFNRKDGYYSGLD